MSRDFLLAHAIVIALVSLVLGPLLLLAVPASAADGRPAAPQRRPEVVAEVRPDAATWRPPVAGQPARLFHLSADPFRRGQHRGVDFAARGPVRSACSGRVVFAGRVAGAGTVSVRCGRWRVSYAPLSRIPVRAGEWIGAGVRLGRAVRGIHFGVRREGRRFGYVDPLPFLAGGRAAPPVLGRPPVSRAPLPRPRAPGPVRPHPAPGRAASQPTDTLAPWPVWLGVALLLTGLVGAGRVRLARRSPGHGLGLGLGEPA